MLNDRVYFSWGSWSLSSSACKAAWSGSSIMTPPFTRLRPRSRVSQDQALLMKLMSTSEPAKIPAKQITNVFFGWEKICKNTWSRILTRLKSHKKIDLNGVSGFFARFTGIFARFAGIFARIIFPKFVNYSKSIHWRSWKKHMQGIQNDLRRNWFSFSLPWSLYESSASLLNFVELNHLHKCV